MSRRGDKRASRVCAAAALALLAVLATALPWRLGNAADTVSAANSASAEDIRDIRGPKGMLPAWLIPALIAGGALLALGGYAAWRWHRRQSVPRALQPFEIALRHLEDIRRLLDPSSVREFSIAISGLVRQYIEDGFKVTATHRTTEEFLHDLLETEDASLAAHRGLLAEFLQQCDMAKFAGVSLSRKIMESLYQSARRFVIETHEAEEAARIPPSTRTEEAHDSLPAT